VSYAMQQPWMQQATIKDNIVCCEPWNEERYKQVIFACALTTDLSIMPLGDATPVAEKGISLSGGQRQRVALARAVYRIADIYLLDNPISALDDQTQEHVWTHLFEGLLQCATVIVGSSRPVISCTAVLHLSTHGVSEGESGVTTFNGPVVARSSAKVPSRYSKTSQSSSPSASADFESSVKFSDVAAKVVPDVTVQIAPHSPKMEPATPATFRSRLGSLNMTIEEAAVGDVSEEVAAYARYADLVEEEEASAEGGIGSAIKNAFFGNHEPHGSVAVEMAAVVSHSPKSGERSQAPSFRARTTSFKDFVEQSIFQDPGNTFSHTDPHVEVPDAADNHPSRERTTSFRERVGSRRASFLEYADTFNIFTSVADLSPPSQVITNQTNMSSIDQNDLSVLGPISEHAETPEPPSSAGPQDNTTKRAQEATQPKHGLRRWVDAGGFRIYLFLFIFYPIAQGTRIVSDSFVRSWAEKTFFSSQQANLEVYSWLVGGYVDCSSQTHFYTCIPTTAQVVFTFSF
jgi:hypothetical protein